MKGTLAWFAVPAALSILSIAIFWNFPFPAKLYALEVEDDINHEKTRKFLENELRKGKYGILITSDYVIDETLTLLRIKHGVAAALKFYKNIKKQKH